MLIIKDSYVYVHIYFISIDNFANPKNHILTNVYLRVLQFGPDHLGQHSSITVNFFLKLYKIIIQKYFIMDVVSCQCKWKIESNYVGRGISIQG